MTYALALVAGMAAILLAQILLTDLLIFKRSFELPSVWFRMPKSMPGPDLLTELWNNKKQLP